MRVCVLGAGAMGRALARRVLAGGHEVAIWNRTPERAREVVEAGARLAGSIATAVEASDVVISSLADDDAVREVALGPDGVRAALDAERGARGPGSPTGPATYADSSTISPSLSAELATVFDGFVAMPVLGGPESVRTGAATYLVGGPEGAVDRLEPVLETLSDTRRRYPSAPMASSAKLSCNLLLLDGVVALAEAFTAARAGGLSDEQLRELFGASPLVAPALANRFEMLLRGGGEGWWSVDLGRKDARLVVELAAGAGCELPVTAAARRRYDEAAADGYADADIAAVARLYR